MKKQVHKSNTRIEGKYTVYTCVNGVEMWLLTEALEFKFDKNDK
jgi:hypothetical protein